MIKYILLSILIFFAFFLLINFIKNKSLSIKHLIIFLLSSLIIYFVYTGKLNYLLLLVKNIIPSLIKIFGI